MNIELIQENNNNIEILDKKPKILHCYKCKKQIYKRFGTYSVCQDCRYELYIYHKNLHNEKKLLNKNNIKKDRIKHTIELNYITTSGQTIIVNTKSENKICKKCLIEKNYQNYQNIKDKYNKYYLSPRCKNCIYDYQLTKSKKLIKILEEDINNNEILI